MVVFWKLGSLEVIQVRKWTFRKPIPGYDISFLITAAHTQMMYKHKLVDFLIHFMQEIDKVSR